MGHIDHGKSTLLDYIRKASVTAKEAGGITQHVGAYETEIEHEGEKRKITFLDTPGHEAFSQMRARGAKTADIAILVVAADDGIKPQTMEAYNAIKEAGLPFIIALNKIDKPGAEPDRAKAQLAENGIYAEGYGGTIPCLKISAKTGDGVPELLDMIILMADMENLETDPSQNASGFIIESILDPKRGVSSTLLIRNGTMKKGMFVLAGNSIAPVRIFENFTGKPIEEALGSSPVRITGFSSLPAVGDEFKTYTTKKEAETAMSSPKQTATKPEEKNILPTMPRPEEKTNKACVQMIIKTDTAGSLEALEKELTKTKDDEVVLSVLRGGVGNVNEDDAKFGSISKDSVILGFNVGIDPSAKEIIERFSIPNFSANIIYDIADWLRKETEKRKNEIPRQEILGVVKILKTFSRQKYKQVIGGKVISGKIMEGKMFKIKRRGAEIEEGKIINLQQGKKEAREVGAENEFGAMTENKIEIAKDDELVIIGK